MKNEYPRAEQRTPSGTWGVWWDERSFSFMPDEATARRCAASGKMLEVLKSVEKCGMPCDKCQDDLSDTIAAATPQTGGE